MITYEMAREMTLWRWKNYPTGQPSKHDWWEKYRCLPPRCNCGFCEYFKTNCRICPLIWEDAEEEDESDYERYSCPCSRNYWHWRYWYLFFSYKEKEKKTAIERMRYWAEKMLEEILASPEHLPEKEYGGK